MQPTASLDPRRRALDAQTPTVPWWRVGVVWLMLIGLGTVVVGSVSLAVEAFAHPDDLVVTATDAPVGTSHAPALIGRNHAATAAPAAK